jgi:peptidoglycan/xylan/chitin deacetylase (PgdA/CDA1 family)
MSETPGVKRISVRKLAARMIKLTAAVACWIYDCSCSQIYQIAGKERAGICTVLYYHSIPSKYQVRFAEQMQLLTRLTTPIDLRSVPTLKAGLRHVAVTFDDALESFFHCAVPVLAQLNITATVFVVADALGGRPTWGDSYYALDERVMSADQLRSLPNLITVGSHTLTHADLAVVTSEEAKAEIGASREKLETLIQRPVKMFSFPFGRFNQGAVEMCAEAGYVRVFTTDPVPAFGKPDEFVVGRVAADPWDSHLEFRLKIAGAYRWDAYLRGAVRTLRSALRHDKQRPRATAPPLQLNK